MVNEIDIIVKDKHGNPTYRNPIKLPSWDENIQEWIQAPLVLEQDKQEPRLQTLGKLKAKLKDIPVSQPDKDFVEASIELLASEIRNRDAHRYTENVRAFHFYLVSKLFIPAFNILLASLEQEELRGRFSKSLFS